MDNIIQIDTEIICETAQQLIEEVYDTFNEQCTNPHYFKKRAILTGTNSDLKELNESLLHQVPGETKTYLSINSCMDPDDAAYVGTEVLYTIEMSGMPEHRLFLKVGAIIILVRNLHVHMKDVNGTRYIITALSSNLIAAKNWELMMMNLYCSFPKLSISQKLRIFFHHEMCSIPCQVSLCDDISESTGTIIGQLWNSS